MKKVCIILIFSALYCMGGGMLAAQSKISLSGGNDRVLSIETRQNVLAVADGYIDRKNEGFVQMIETIENPFTFEQPEAEAASGVIVPVAVNPKAGSVVYDDRSILSAIAQSFSGQVRGTLARGDVRYLQLKGGTLLKVGASFPAKIPQIPGQTFEINIADIDSAGYTLQLGDSTVTVPYEESSGTATTVKSSEQ